MAGTRTDVKRGTSSDLSVDPQEAPNVLLLVPGSPKLLVWEVVSCALLLWVAVAVPYQIAFVRRGRWDVTFWATYWETLVDLFFIADIVRSCFTAYNDHGTLVLDRRKIFRHYMRSWFLIDFVASFPLDWFVGFVLSDEEEVGSQLLLLLRLVKLWKLLRLLRLWRIGLRLQLDSGTFPLAEAVIAITSSSSFWYVTRAAIVYLVVHFSGCLQVFFANFYADVDDQEDGSWLIRSGLSGKSVEEQYAGALVHALLQMLLVAPGLVAPVGQSEYLIYFISLLVGGFSLMHLIASLTARQVTTLFGPQGEFNRRMDDLERYMDHHQFEPELRLQIRMHQELKYPDGHCFDEETIQRNLSRPLQEKTRLHTCRALMAKLQIPLETEQGFELAASLAMRLKRRVFLPGDYLIKQGTKPEGMFFISDVITSHPGEVEILQREELQDAVDTYKRIPFKGGERIVGEISLLRDTEATAFVRAKTVCDTELLLRDDYKALVDSFPLFEEYLQQVATSRGFSDYTQAMANYDSLEKPKTITMVKIAALQGCKELTQTGITSFGILEEFYERYRIPEGVVRDNPGVVLGKICRDGSLCHQDTGKVLSFNQDNTVAIHTVEPNGHVLGPGGEFVGYMRPDDTCGDDQDGRGVFDGLVFEEELKSWVPAGQSKELNTERQVKSISKLLPDDAFVKVAFEDLGTTSYGVLTYTWNGMPWRDILEELNGANGTKLDLFWIDIFCVNQALAPEEKMRTIKQTVTLYSKASEHHIMGYRTLRRGWYVHHHLFIACPLAYAHTHPCNRYCPSPLCAGACAS